MVFTVFLCFSVFYVLYGILWFLRYLTTVPESRGTLLDVDNFKRTTKVIADN